MKKVLSAAVAALLVVAMSVVAFAYEVETKLPITAAPLFYEENGDTYIGTLVTSTLTNAQKDFLRAWLKSDTNMLLYNRSSSSSNVVISFFIFSSDTVVTAASASSDQPFYGKLSFESGRQYSILQFDAATGKQVGDGTLCNTTGTSKSADTTSAGFGTFISGTIFNKFSNVSLPSSALLDFDGRLYIEDDDGLLEGDEPPASSEPESSEPAFNFPEIQPTDNEYIAYDVTVWNRAADVIKQSAGNSINISWLILAMVMGWLLVSRIVKKLSK